jgi:hypothetical protein
MGEGDGFPRIWVVVSLVSLGLPVVSLSTKGGANQLVVGFRCMFT